MCLPFGTNGFEKVTNPADFIWEVPPDICRAFIYMEGGVNSLSSFGSYPAGATGFVLDVTPGEKFLFVTCPGARGGNASGSSSLNKPASPGGNGIAMFEGEEEEFSKIIAAVGGNGGIQTFQTKGGNVYFTTYDFGGPGGGDVGANGDNTAGRGCGIGGSQTAGGSNGGTQLAGGTYFSAQGYSAPGGAGGGGGYYGGGGGGWIGKTGSGQSYSSGGGGSGHYSVPSSRRPVKIYYGQQLGGYAYTDSIGASLYIQY